MHGVREYSIYITHTACIRTYKLVVIMKDQSLILYLITKVLYNFVLEFIISRNDTNE